MYILLGIYYSYMQYHTGITHTQVLFTHPPFCFFPRNFVSSSVNCNNIPINRLTE